MNNHQKLKRRELFQWALAAGVSTYLIDRGKSWGKMDEVYKLRQTSILALIINGKSLPLRNNWMT